MYLYLVFGGLHLGFGGFVVWEEVGCVIAREAIEVEQLFIHFRSHTSQLFYVKVLYSDFIVKVKMYKL